MHIARSVFLLLTVMHCRLSAQNLVMNPSFEEIKPNAVIVACEFMQYSQYFGEKIKFWTTDRYMTPDVLQAADNCPWLNTVHSGQQCLGLVYYLPAADVDGREDYHEVVRGRLKLPLQPGRRYIVECWVREDSSIIREHLARVYTPKTPVAPTKAGNLGFYFYVRNPLAETKPQVNFAKPIETNGKWVKLSAEFVPDEPFEYFLLGNFFSDKNTATNLSAEKNREVEQKNGKMGSNIDKIKRAAYLCIDDVSVAPAPETVEKALTEAKKFTFSAELLFDFDKAELRAEAAPQLNELVDFMKNHTEIRLGISGHTDNVGSDDYNMDLSERRAAAVRQYLADHGVDAGRIRVKGFGETKPIADNLLEAGRQANRRVECVVLK